MRELVVGYQRVEVERDMMKGIKELPDRTNYQLGLAERKSFVPVGALRHF
jgi:hypothetical protein